MKVLIIEDETAAVGNLKLLLTEYDIEIVDILESVTDSVDWLRSNSEPDLILLDIHLADGNAFQIFKMVDINTPIIFTTAYDQYAIKAFELNSIDYLLKPIDSTKLKKAITKLQRLTLSEKQNYNKKVSNTAKEHNIVMNFLIPSKDKLIPISCNEIAFYYTSNEKVTIHTLSGEILPYDKSLDTIINALPTSDFFRANRQFIISRNAIKDLSVWFGSRLSLNLNVPTPERIIISKARTPEFKQWYITQV